MSSPIFDVSWLTAALSLSSILAKVRASRMGKVDASFSCGLRYTPKARTRIVDVAVRVETRKVDVAARVEKC